MASKTVVVEVEERRLRLSNLEKVLYPEAAFTKGAVIDYYRQISPAMLPHLADRPITLRRYPDGVDKAPFFEKDVSRHAPHWVRTVRLAAPRSTKGDSIENHHVLVQDLPTLVWVANLAGLEIHAPQWTVGPRGGHRNPDLLVFDLDPGAPADLVDCCGVAVRIRDILNDDGLVAYPKTSGSKGLQLYVAIESSTLDSSTTYAKEIASRLAIESPGHVVARMAKAERAGKVFVDWSQNNPAKTTIAPYSLRGNAQPTVATPVTWDEVEACHDREDLLFTPNQVVQRVKQSGDLLKPLLKGPRQRL